ncbi:hypothetical protein LguiA_021236 [Lonicera macranthoides]
MEDRMKKYRQVSPERAKVWTERSPKYQQNRKVPVVYYLSRNRQLEHPHFIEVPSSSPDGLYLRDVIDKLNVLRGRGVASLYSWSCKRSYKSGYVWHDLSEDDLILPAHGSEYVLKGSELFEDSNSGHLGPVQNTRSPISKQLLEPPTSRSQDESSSSASISERDTMHSQDNELSPPVEHPGSSSVSPKSRDGKNSSSGGSLSLTEYKVYRSDGLADAATQTECTMNKGNEAKETCSIGVSTDDGSLEPESNDTCENCIPLAKENLDLCVDSISRPCSSSSPFLSVKAETLETLIRADVKKLNSLRVVEGGESLISCNTKLKASNMLMQLISCGSISVKDHSFGLIPNYRPSFAQSNFPSPLFSTSVMLGELDCLAENPKLLGSLRLENKEYLSGSLVEANMLKGVGITALKRSSSYNADRGGKQLDSVADKEEITSSSSKCIPLSIKASLSKQPRSESMRSPVSEGPRISSDRVESLRIISPCVSNSGSQRITEPSEKKSSKRLDSFKEEKDNVIKIEESLLQVPGL